MPLDFDPQHWTLTFSDTGAVEVFKPADALPESTPFVPAETVKAVNKEVKKELEKEQERGDCPRKRELINEIFKYWINYHNEI